MSTGKKTCHRFADLLISRHVLKDIGRADDAALTRHLGTCAACRRQERQLLALHAASRALPELKTSGAFERRLYRELAIPRHDRPERAAGALSRLLALFDTAGSRLKPLAAFCTVLLVQVVLLRAYFLPVRHDSQPVRARIEERREPASPLDARLTTILPANTLRGSVTSEVRTLRHPLPAPRTFPAVDRLTTTDRMPSPPLGYAPSMTDRKTADRRMLYKKAPDKTSNDDTPNRDGLNKQKTDSDTRQKDETVKNKQSRRFADREDRSTAGGSAAGSDTGSRDKNMSQKSSPGGDTVGSMDKTMSKKSGPDTGKQADQLRIAQGMTQNGGNGRLRGTATIGRNAAPALPPQRGQRFRTEHRVTLNLIVPPEQETTVSRLTPLLSREVRSRYGEGSKVALKITTLPAPATQPEDNRAPWALLLVLVLEGTVRMLLFLYLKKSGRLTAGTGSLALLLGTLSLPWFLLRKTRLD